MDQALIERWPLASCRKYYLRTPCRAEPPRKLKRRYVYYEDASSRLYLPLPIPSAFQEERVRPKPGVE